MPFIGRPGVMNHRSVRDATPYVGCIRPVDPAGLIPYMQQLDITLGAIPSASAAAAQGNAGNALIDLYMSLRVMHNLVDDKAPRTTSGYVNSPLFFQFFPESVSDSRNMSIENTGPPTVSDVVPLVSGPSQRNIGFTLRFVRERWEKGKPTLAPPWDKYNVDVGSALQMLRSFTYPVELGRPQAVSLELPWTYIGTDKTPHKVFGLITNYSSEYRAFFPDGTPRMADVDVSFTEYPILEPGGQGSTFTSGFLVRRGSFAKALERCAQGFYSFIRDTELGVGGVTRTTAPAGTVVKPPDVQRGSETLTGLFKKYELGEKLSSLEALIDGTAAAIAKIEDGSKQNNINPETKQPAKVPSVYNEYFRPMG